MRGKSTGHREYLNDQQKKAENCNNDGDLMLVEQQNVNKKVMVLEAIVPLTIDIGKQLEHTNINKVDMDNDNDLEDNTEQVAIPGDLSPKKIHMLSAKHGK